jgi:hypothetical protein
LTVYALRVGQIKQDDKMRKASICDMAVKIIGTASYSFNNPPYSGSGEFYLTEEILKELEQLQLKAEETIFHQIHTGFRDSCGCSSSRTASPHSGISESIDGPNRKRPSSAPLFRKSRNKK